MSQDKRIERYKDILSFFNKPGDILDIGAKDSMMHDFVSNVRFKDDCSCCEVCNFFNYHAVDIDKEVIHELKERNVSCSVMNAEDLQFDKKTFNYVLMGEVLEHIPNMGLVLEEVHRVLKDDGYFIFSVSNGELKTRLYFLLKKFYKIPFIKKCEKRPVKQGGHIHMFNIRHLKVLLKTFNFEIDEYIGHRASHEYIIMRCKKC